jgi:iron complex outermembrane recepter protein
VLLKHDLLDHVFSARTRAGGAASVLFGAAAPGGVLNTVSKRPTDTPFKQFKVEGGNFGHAAVAGDVNIPLSDEWAMRLVGLARNSETVVDYIPNDSLYFAPSLAWTPSDDTTLVVQAYALKRETAYIYGVPVEGSLLPSPYGEIPRNRFVGEPDFDRQETRQYALSYHFSHDFTDSLSLRHGLRYLDARNDVPFIGLDGWNATTPSMQDRTAYDNALSSRGVSTDTSLEYKTVTGAVEHTLIGGVDYARYTNHDQWWFAAIDPLDMFDPVYGAQPGTMTYDGDYGGTISRLGVYAQDQVELGNLTVLLGGRHDWAEDTPIGEDTANTSAFTARAGAVYRFDNGFAPFVSFSQSFQPQSGFDNNGNRYEPTRGEQY